LRNFEERKMEVLLRSEKRIKEQKRTRNKVLFTCTPILICLVILSVAGFKSINLFKNTDKVACSDSMIEIKSEDGTYYKIYKSEKDIVNMSTSIQSITNLPLNCNAENYGLRPDEFISSKNSYIITITQPDKETIIYHLCGSLLTCDNTNQYFYLSDEQVNNLIISLNLENK